MNDPYVIIEKKYRITKNTTRNRTLNTLANHMTVRRVKYSQISIKKDDYFD